MLITQEHFNKIYQDNQVPFTLLVLILDNKCNATCKVCIAKHVFKSSLCKQYCEKFPECNYSRCCDHYATDEEFYAGVKNALATINSPHLSVIVSGGEPTLSSRFKGTFELLEEYKHKITEIRMETNGANLADEEVKAILLKNNVKILLSRYNHIEEDNLKEFGFLSHPVSNEALKGFVQSYGSNLQINTIILKKFIPDAETLLKVASEMRALGVTAHEFVEIMADTTLEASNKDLIKYYNEQLITAEELHKQLIQLDAEVIQSSTSEAEGYTRYRKDDLVFSITYCNLAKKYLTNTNNFFRKFLIEPSGEIAIDSIEKE